MTFSFPGSTAAWERKMSPLKFAESQKGIYYYKVINKSRCLFYAKCPAGPKGCARSTILMFVMNLAGSLCLTHGPVLEKFCS